MGQLDAHAHAGTGMRMGKGAPSAEEGGGEKRKAERWERHVERFLERRTRQAKKGPSVSGGGLMQDLLERCLDPASTDLTRAKPRKASVF